MPLDPHCVALMAVMEGLARELAKADPLWRCRMVHAKDTPCFVVMYKHIAVTYPGCPIRGEVLLHPKLRRVQARARGLARGTSAVDFPELILRRHHPELLRLFAEYFQQAKQQLEQRRKRRRP